MRGKRPFRKKSLLDQYLSAQNASDHQERLTADVDQNFARLKTFWADCDDLQYRWITVGETRAVCVWITTLLNKHLVQHGVFEPLTRYQGNVHTLKQIEDILFAPTFYQVQTFHQVNLSLTNGMIALFFEGLEECLVVEMIGEQNRGIEKPELEPSVLGAQIAFTENLHLSIGLVRRRLKSHRVKFKIITLGTISKTRIAICFIDGIVKETYLKEVLNRLETIKIDAIQDTYYIVEQIKDAPYSLFPTLQLTERPDRVAGALLEGRLAILVDGSPIAVLAPSTFPGLLHASEDYAQSYTVVLPLRLIRHFAFWSSMFLTAIYVALLSYHQEMIPSALLINVSESRLGIPFPAVVETLLMEMSFEIFREAGIRLPKAIGQSISIVGTLVIGEAAVSAGLVSPLVVIFVALTGIASFSIPEYRLAMAVRFLRFVMIIVAGAFGLYGVVLAVLILLTHMVSLRSLGVPYMSPIAPFIPRDQQDAIFRTPFWNMEKRPATFEPVDEIRNTTQVPSVQHTQKED